VFAPKSSRYLAFIAVVPKPQKSSSSGRSSGSSGHYKTPLYRPLTASATSAAVAHAQNASNKKNSSGDSTSTNTTTPAAVSAHHPVERVLMCLDLERISPATTNPQPWRPLLQWNARDRRNSRSGSSGRSPPPSSSKRRAIDSVRTSSSSSLEERLRRERQRSISAAGSLTEFSWVQRRRRRNDKGDNTDNNDDNSDSEDDGSSLRNLRLLVPARGSLYVQDGLVLDDGDDDDDDDDDNGDRNHTTNGGTDNNDNIDQEHPVVQCTCIHDKSATGLSAIDAQLSPDGSMVAWTADGELYVQAAERPHDAGAAVAATADSTTPAIRVSFGACQSEAVSISHGVADFVAQEEMDRYRGFWWHPDSTAILFTRNDESAVPLYRILHHQSSSSSSQQAAASSDASGHGDNSSHGLLLNHHHRGGSSSGHSMFEDHRYPFAGKMNPAVRLGLVRIDRDSILNYAAEVAITSTTRIPPVASAIVESRDGVADGGSAVAGCESRNDNGDDDDDPMQVLTAQDVAAEHWAACEWLDAPREATEYLARVHWLPDGCSVVQWQDRTQKCTVLQRLDLRRRRPPNSPNDKEDDNNDNERPGSGKGRTLLVERSDVWINLHHMFRVVSRPIHPDECCDVVERSRLPSMPSPLPEGSFSFLFASERTGYAHLYLYTYCPGVNGEQAVLIRSLTSGDWIVESILGVDVEKDVVYFTGTFDSVLERHLYAIPLLGKTNQHTWRRGASARAIVSGGREETQLPSMADTEATPAPMALQSSASEESFKSPSPPSPAVLAAAGVNNTKNNNSSTPHGRGVRRGLSKVMHALSGKGGRHSAKAENRYHPVEIALTSNTGNSFGPTRLTAESGMHSIVMDDNCRFFVDTCSDLGRPTTVKIYELPTDSRMNVKRIMTVYDAVHDDKFLDCVKSMTNGKKSESTDLVKCLPAPELLTFPTSDGTETLHAAVYRPDPRVHGPGPYPLVCAVYGGPHVQRVNRSWSQCADMRAQRLRSLGFCVVKCDNRGSSRRGLAFESAISRRLGRLEVLDQVAAVRQLIVRGIADASRVGVYGWSYGGYLSAMCLCRAPDVFHVAVAGAPVTSWDGYDTHYTERYMGLPADNLTGYRESAVFDHTPNMRGKLMIVHGLIDENVHFRHTTRLINKLVAAGKDYDLLIFPDERHSPRRLRDRIYMEQRISEYFVKHLGSAANPTALDLVMAAGSVRAMAGHL